MRVIDRARGSGRSLTLPDTHRRVPQTRSNICSTSPTNSICPCSFHSSIHLCEPVAVEPFHLHLPRNISPPHGELAELDGERFYTYNCCGGNLLWFSSGKEYDANGEILECLDRRERK